MRIRAGRGQWLALAWAVALTGSVRVGPEGFEVEGTVEIVQADDFWLRDPDGNLFRLTVRDPAEMPAEGEGVRVEAVNCGGHQLAQRIEPVGRR